MVLYLSTKPDNALSFFPQLWKYDKVVHFIEYLGVGFLLINAMKIRPLQKTQWKYILGFYSYSQLLMSFFNSIHQQGFQILLMLSLIYLGA